MNNEILETLQKHFSTEDGRILLKALRRNPAVWAVMQQETAIDLIHKDHLSRFEGWTPAAIAGRLSSQGSERELCACEKALVEACEIAQLLQTHAQQHVTWTQVFQDWKRSDEYPADPSTVLAILSTPDEEGEAVLSAWGQVNNPRITGETICQAVLSQPARKNDTLNVLVRIFTSQSLAGQTAAIQALVRFGEGDLAEELAQALVINNPSLSGDALSPQASDELLTAAELYRKSALIFQAAGNERKTREHLRRARAMLKACENSILAQENAIRISFRDEDPIEQLQVKSIDGMAEEQPRDEPAPACVDQLFQTELEQAECISKAGNDSLAKDTLEKAARQLAANLKKYDANAIPAFSLEWKPAAWVKALVRFGLTDLADEIGKMLTRLCPNDVELLQCVAEIACQKTDYPQAVEVSRAALALGMGDIETRRTLAKAYEGMSLWSKAYDERQRTTLQPECSDDDWLALGLAALAVNQPYRTMEACRKVLHNQPECGKAYAYLGKACMALNKVDEAETNLKLATVSSPEESEGWLSLNDLYESQGESERGFEALRAGVISAPDSAEINYRLGRNYHQKGWLSEALPYLQKANELGGNNPEAAVLLVKTLEELGRMEDTHAVVEQAYARWPKSPYLAYQYGIRKLEANDCPAALKPLALAAESDQAQAEWKLAHARALLGDEYHAYSSTKVSGGKAVEEAEQVLKGILKEKTGWPEAQLYLADAIRQKGDPATAMEMYNLLEKSDSGLNSGLHWRVLAGLGRAALVLGKLDEAAAAFGGASTENPAETGLRRLLAETFQIAGHVEEAYNLGREIFQQEPGEVNNIAWYADLLRRLGNLAEAISAYQNLLEIDPENVSAINALAETQSAAGQAMEAVETIEKLLHAQSDGRSLCDGAGLAARMQAHDLSIRCLEKALALEPSIEILVQLGCAYRNHQDLANAQRVLERVKEMLPADVVLACLLAETEAAGDELDRAVEELKTSLSYENDAAETQDILSRLSQQEGLVPAEWMRFTVGKHANRIEYSRLLVKNGQKDAAAAFIDNELNSGNPDPAMCVLAAELALERLDYEALKKAAIIFNDCREQAGETEKRQMAVLEAQAALDSGQVQAAEQILGQADGDGVEDAAADWLRAAIQARLGRWTDAKQAKEQLEARSSVDNRLALSAGLNRAEALLALGEWDKAVVACQSLQPANPHNLRIARILLQALVVSAEMRDRFLQLGAQRHAPGKEKLDVDHRAEINRLLTILKPALSEETYNRWSARVQVAFEPETSAIRQLAMVEPEAESLASIMRGLRLTNQSAAAVKVAQRFPDNFTVQMEKGLALCGVDAGEALSEAVEMADTYSQHPLSYALLAKAAEKAGRLDVAADALEGALAIWNDESAWHSWAARLYQQCGQPAEALGHLEDASQIDPDNAEVMAALGKTYLQSEDYKKAVGALEQAVRANPDETETWERLADAYYLDGDRSNALRCAGKAFVLDSSSVKTYLLSGQINLSNGSNEKALEQARLAVSRNRQNPEAVVFLAHVLDESGKAEEALNVLRSAAESGVMNALTVQEEARLLWKMKDIKAALDVLNRGEETFTEDHALLALKAQILAEHGNLEDAEQAAILSLRIQPRQPEIHRLLGKTHRAEGNLDKAIHHFSKVVELQPDDFEAYAELSKTYMNQREYALALDVLQKAIKANPQDTRAYCEAANLLRDAKDYAGAETMLKRASELAPGNLQIKRQLAAVVALNLVHHSQEVNSNL